MRAYLPLTRTGLHDLVTSGGIGPAPLVAFAVTGSLRESYAEGDEEELEYVAMTAAARAALVLLARTEDENEPPLRMVVAVEVDEAYPFDEEGAAGVELPHAVSLRQVAAVHADTAEAGPTVAEAVAMLRSGGPRDDDEEFLLDACEGHELAWFATQEIGDLLA